MNITGFALLDRRQVLVRGYVGLLGFAGTAIGLWSQSIILTLFGALMLGAFLSQSFPIWREVTGEQDQRFLDHMLRGNKQAKFYYWLFPMVTVLLIVIALAAKLHG